MTEPREPEDAQDRGAQPGPPHAEPRRSDAEERVSTEEIRSSVTPAVRIAAAWSWRLIIIAAAIALAAYIVVTLRLIVIPVVAAVLVSALLVPLVNLLTRHRWKRGLAVLLAVVTAILIIALLIALVVWQISEEAGEVRDRTLESYEAFKDFLAQSPLQLTEGFLGDFVTTIFSGIQDDTSAIISGALSIGTTFSHMATGALLGLFALIFILYDGVNIWSWLTLFVPKRARLAVDRAGRAGWRTLENYARTQILVASLDALGIGLGAFFLGLPLAIPISVLVFLGAFVPIVGAIVTGAVAVFIALVYNGPVIAAIMLLVVLVVQQVEGHVLQPLLMGTAVKVHPLGVVLVVAAGTLLAGIPGAIFAVPLAAIVNVMIGTITTGAWKNADTSYTTDLIWQTVPREGPLQRGSQNTDKE